VFIGVIQGMRSLTDCTIRRRGDSRAGRTPMWLRVLFSLKCERFGVGMFDQHGWLKTRDFQRCGGMLPASRTGLVSHKITI
jgi:hypothetical protein